MLSRQTAARTYGVTNPGMNVKDGAPRIAPNGMSYAIARPASSPTAARAPQYLYQYPSVAQEQHNRSAMTGGTMPLQLRTNTNPPLKSGG